MNCLILFLSTTSTHCCILPYISLPLVLSLSHGLGCLMRELIQEEETPISCMANCFTEMYCCLKLWSVGAEGRNWAGFWPREGKRGCRHRVGNYLEMALFLQRIPTFQLSVVFTCGSKSINTTVCVSICVSVYLSIYLSVLPKFFLKCQRNLYWGQAASR